MDIDFASFVDQAQDIRPYENSAAYIVNLADRELYAGSEGELTTVPLDDSLYNILIG